MEREGGFGDGRGWRRGEDGLRDILEGCSHIFAFPNYKCVPIGTHHLKALPKLNC